MRIFLRFLSARCLLFLSHACGGWCVVDSVLFGLLREQVATYLDNLQQLAEDRDDQTILDVARAEFLRLIAAWQALLELHLPTKHGLCPWCQRRWCFLRRSGVCTVWRAAYTYFITSPEKGEQA